MLKKLVYSIHEVCDNRSASQGYDISKKAWEQIVDGTNVEYKTANHNHGLIPQFSKYRITDLLQEYDQVLVVDADTLPMPGALDIFQYNNHSVAGVLNFGSYEAICRPMEMWPNVFEELRFVKNISPFKMVNSGVLLYNKDALRWLNSWICWFSQKEYAIQEWSHHLKTGKDQILFNLWLKYHCVDYDLLPWTYNVQDLPRRDCDLGNLYWLEMGKIFHFNAGCKPTPGEWIKKVYESLYVQQPQNCM